MNQLATQEVPVGNAAPPALPVLGFTAVLRKVFSFPAMLMAWIVLIVVRLAERNLPDPDIWWHLRNAQYLIAHHTLPNLDTYSFTVVGHFWMDPEWLAEIPYYLGHRSMLSDLVLTLLALYGGLFLSVGEILNSRCLSTAARISSNMPACLGIMRRCWSLANRGRFWMNIKSAMYAFRPMRPSHICFGGIQIGESISPGGYSTLFERLGPMLAGPPKDATFSKQLRAW
jgi:hypothetical protein